MASTKLTVALRDAIVNNAMKGAFQRELDALRSQNIELTKKVYRLWVSEEQEKYMKKLPHGFFFVQTGYLSVSLRDENEQIIEEIGRKTALLDFGEGVRMPANRSAQSGHVSLMNKELSLARWAIERQYEAIDRKKIQLRQEIKAVVNSVNTTAKLIAVWPEAERFIPTELVEPSHKNLPAVIIDGLNKLLTAARPELTAAA